MIRNHFFFSEVLKKTGATRIFFFFSFIAHFQLKNQVGFRLLPFPEPIVGHIPFVWLPTNS